MEEDILKIENLKVRFYTYEGTVKAIENINLNVKKGETLGLVGETGCGKSVTGLSILNLVPTPGKIEDGHIFFEDAGKTVDMLSQDEGLLRTMRGKNISMVFQEPNAALNPLYTVESQISEVYKQHRMKDICKTALEEIEKEIQGGKANFSTRVEKGMFETLLKNPNSFSMKFFSKIPILNRYKKRLKKILTEDIVEILREMGIPDPERVVEMYPHELSGGMQQRVVIATALACNPVFLIADEPTTSLDVTIQAQILNLIGILKKRFGSTVLYITHDMGVVAELCDRVAVMYAGSIAEVADVTEIFKNPLHPYTRGLLESIPRPNKEFKSIRGSVPDLIAPPSGCRFHPRCPYAMDICTKVKSKSTETKKGHLVECHLYARQVNTK